MVELFSTSAVAMADLSMGLIVGSALADRTSAKKSPCLKEAAVLRPITVYSW